MGRLKDKTPLPNDREEMKRVAHPRKPPVVVPVVVVPVNIHLALVVPTIEGRMYKMPSIPSPFEILRIEFHSASQCVSILYQVSSFFEVST